MEKIMDDEQFLNLVDGIMNAIQINYNEHQTYFSHKKYFFPSISDTKYREVASIYSIWKVLNHDVLSMSLNCNYRLKANINKKISKLYEEFEEIFYNFLFDNKEKALLGYGKVLGNANKKYKTIHDDFINIIKNYLSNTFNENHIDLIMGNLTSLLKYSGSYSLKQQKGILNQFLKEIDYNCDDLSNVKQMIENKLFSLIDDEIKHFEKTFYDELKKRRFKIDLSKNSKICNQIVGKYWIYKLLCDDKNINELYSLMEKDNVKNYKKLIEILSNHVANATEYIFYDYLNILKNSYIYENNVFFACLGEKVSDFFQISFKYLEYNRKIFIYFLDSMLFDVYDTLTSNGIEVRNSIAEIVQKNIDSNDDRTFFHIKSDESRRNHDNNQLIYIRQLKLITNSNNHVTNNHRIEDISILVDRVDEFGNLLRPLNYNVHYCLECKEFFDFLDSFNSQHNIDCDNLLLNIIYEDEENLRDLRDINDFKKKSLLSKLGYKVGVTGLNEEQRRMILKKTIESGLMTCGEIKSHLEFCISYFKNKISMEKAVKDWKSDMEFIAINQDKFSLINKKYY